MKFKAKTFKIDFESGRIQGTIDDLDSVRQASVVMLSTPRFQHEIYSRNFGNDLQDLIGKPKAYVLGDVQRMIREALLADERIFSVENFEVENKGESIKIRFRICSVYGDFMGERSLFANE